MGKQFEDRIRDATDRARAARDNEAALKASREAERKVRADKLNALAGDWHARIAPTFVVAVLKANQLLGSTGFQLTTRHVPVVVSSGTDPVAHLQGLQIDVVREPADRPMSPPRMRPMAGGARGSQTIADPPSLRIAITSPDDITVTSTDDAAGQTEVTTFRASNFDEEQIESLVADLVDQVIPKPKA